MGEEYKERGFYPVVLEKFPESFVTFREWELHSIDSGECYGYVVNLENIKETSSKRGHDYKYYKIESGEAPKSLTFGKEGTNNDVYVYDATGKVFYAKGYGIEDEIYHSDKKNESLIEDITSDSTKETYEINYFNDGMQVQTQAKRKGEDIRLRLTNRLKKEGNVLKGFDTSSSATNVVYKLGDIYKEDDNINLYAVWKNGSGEVYTITFNANGGKNAPAPIEKTEGTTVLLPTEIPTREEYTFVGWSKESTGEDENYYNPGEGYDEEGNATLYAIWTKEPVGVTLTVNPEGSGKAIKSGTEKVGKTIYLSAVANEGYEFLNWTGNIDLKNKNATTTSFTMPNKAVYLTANFSGEGKSKCEIIFDANGGYIYSGDEKVDKITKEVGVGEEYGELPVALGENATFKGWFRAENSEKQITSESIVQEIDNGITLYAKWETEKVAVYSETDNSLRFIKPKGPIEEGKEYDGRIYTSIYTEFENKEYKSQNSVPWYGNRENIQKIIFETEIKSTSTAYWFAEQRNVTSIDVEKLDVSETLDMKYMFRYAGYNAGTFEITGLEDWVTRKVTNMSSMFDNAGYNASTWNIGDLSKWNTGSVTTMASMFSSAGYKATTWNIGDLSKWNTGKVTNMSSMFCNTGRGATTWNIGDLSEKTINKEDGTTYIAWDVSSVTNMSDMFNYAGGGAGSFKIIGLDNWNTSSVTNMEGMFAYAGYNAKSEWSIGDLSDWNTKSVTDISGMFWNAGYNCTTTWGIGDIGEWNTINVTTMADMFREAGRNAKNWSVGELNLKNITKNGETYIAWNTQSVRDMWRMFYNAGFMAETWNIGNLNDWDVSKVNMMEQMFYRTGYSAKNWNIGDLSNWDTSKVQNMKQMFYCAGYNAKIWNIGDLSNWKTSKVGLGAGSFVSMFHGAGYNAEELFTLNLSNWDMTNAKDTSSMFYNCRKLEKLDISGWNNANITTASNMFYGCTALKTVTLGGENFKWVGNAYLPEPKLNGSDGYWYNIQTGEKYLPKEIPAEKIATYSAIPINRGAFAVYSETDNSLTFYKNNDNVVVGEIYNGKKVTKVYTGIESRTDASPLWENETNLITTVEVVDKISPVVTTQWFAGFENLTSINLQKLDTSYVTNMAKMFYGCTKLASLDVSNFYTSNVTSMYGMFMNCPALISLDLSKFDTSSVANMHAMFRGCDKLENIYISNWNTQNVTDMGWMFYECYSLQEIDISNWNIQNVKDMDQMFSACAKLKSLDLSNWNTQNLTSMQSMFYACRMLETLKLNNFNTSKIGSSGVYRMFKYCDTLQEITLGPNFDWKGDEGYLPEPTSSNITGADGKWYDKNTGIGYAPTAIPQRSIVTTYSAKPIYIVTFDANGGTVYDLGDITTTRLVEYGNTYGSMDIPSVVLNGYEFTGWYTEKTGGTKIDNLLNQKLTGNITLYARWEVGAIAIYSETDGSLTFYNRGELPNVRDTYNNKIVTKIYTGIENTEYTTTNRAPWYSVRAQITQISIKDKLTPSSTSCWFYYCYKATSIDLTNLDTSMVTDMSNMFAHCEALTSLSLTNLDTSKVTDMSHMFEYCDVLTSLDVTKLDTSKVTDMSYMFSNCRKMTSLKLNNSGTTKFLTSSVKNMEYMFNYCFELTTIDVSKFNTANVTNMDSMFSHCYVVSSLAVDNFDTSKVTNMSEVFGYCYALTSLKLNKWDTSNVTDFSFMFLVCEKLKTLNISGFDTQKATNMCSMFGNCNSLAYVDVSGFITTEVTDMYGMFGGTAITTLDLSHFNTSKVIDMAEMFADCDNLTSLNITGWDTSKVEYMQMMFENCSRLTTLDIEDWNTESVTYMRWMFRNCTNLRLNCRNWNVENVTDYTDFAYGANGVTPPIWVN